MGPGLPPSLKLRRPSVQAPAKPLDAPKSAFGRRRLAETARRDDIGSVAPARQPSPLQSRLQLEIAEAEIVPPDPLVQFGGRVLLVPQIVGEGKALPVDIGLQERRQRRD